MIYFDTTRASSWRHSSGLARVSARLRSELGSAAQPFQWPGMAGAPGPDDWVLTPELFDETERPGFSRFVEDGTCGFAAIFHDAIPLRHPDITWPRSVERHPSYMKLLSRFDRIWAVSSESRDELTGFWKWQNAPGRPRVEVLALGADWPGIERRKPTVNTGLPLVIVSVGILEPRKNQGVLLDACEALLLEGIQLELHLVGRVNPHFGKPIAQRAESMSRRWPGIRHHQSMTDADLASLVSRARATAFSSIAEGCGLPLLESLWMGVPCVCSGIAPLRDNAAAGGCLVVPENNAEAWTAALRAVLTDDSLHSRLALEAAARELPTWSAAARVILTALGGS